MNEEIEVINLEDPSQTVDLIKVFISQALEECEEEFLNLEVKDQSDFETEEEYLEYFKDLQNQLIDDIEEIKLSIFQTVLYSYNKFVGEKNLLELDALNAKKESEEMINFTSRDIKRATISSIGISLIFPSFIPAVFIINFPRLWANFHVNEYHIGRMEAYEDAKERFKEIQLPYYELMDTIRTDYHKSKKELEELRKNVEDGENIIPYLFSQIGPERLSINRYDLSNLEFDIEEPKELTKEK